MKAVCHWWRPHKKHLKSKSYSEAVNEFKKETLEHMISLFVTQMDVKTRQELSVSETKS